MDIKKLKCFISVADNLHFGKAAESLNISQPPLSQSIMSLEKELGAPLFIRTKRSVKLTKLGIYWYDHVKEALNKVNSLDLIAKNIINGKSGRILISFSSFFSHMDFFSRLIYDFKKKYSNIDLILEEKTNDCQIIDILNNNLDIGLIIKPLNIDKYYNIEYIDLMSEELLVAIPKSWIDSIIKIEGESVEFSHILNLPLISFPKDKSSYLYKLIQDGYLKNGAVPNIVQEASELQTILSLVNMGVGLSFIPSSFMNIKIDGISYFKISGYSFNIILGMIWNKNNSSDIIDSLAMIANNIKYNI